MANLMVKRVSKAYGTQLALRNISIEVMDGELLVLLGPSGCGKTTLLRTIAGLEVPDEGAIILDGSDITRWPPHKRNVAFVFQSYALYPNLSVFDNIAFPLRAMRTPRTESSQRVREVALQLGLVELLRRRPSQLSGGQRQRVALARAIIRNPALFLMDEPLSNLDAKLRNTTRREILRLQRRLSVTTLFVTHDQVEAMTMGDRVAILNEGNLLQVGTPREIYEQPSNTFVAGFIGSPPMNLVSAQLTVSESNIFRHLGGNSWTVPSQGSLSRLPQPCFLGVRPERIQLAEPESATIRGTVDLVEDLGSETLVTVVWEGHEWLVKCPGAVHHVRGENVGMLLSPADVHVFDATGSFASMVGGLVP